MIYNWPKHQYLPIEVEGGIMFPPGMYAEARACVSRIIASGRFSTMYTYPGDLGIFVSAR